MSGPYTLAKISFKDWSIIGYPFYLEHLQKDLFNLAAIVSYVEDTGWSQPFKWAIESESVQFLAGIFPQTREIRIGSKQLGYELNVLSFDEDETLHEHASKIAELPLENTPTMIKFISHQYQLPLFDGDEFQKVHKREQELAQILIQKLNTYRQSWFERFSDFGLDLTANFMLIRIHLLKFLAILPNLDHDQSGREVKRIFCESIRRLIADSKLAKRKNLKGQKRSLPNKYMLVLKMIYQVAQYTPASWLCYGLRKSVALMATRFIAGVNIKQANTALAELRQSGRDSTIDQLGELVVSRDEADKYLNEVLDIIRGINSGGEIGEKNLAGIYRSHVSIKVSALAQDFKPQDFEYTYNQVAPRLKTILLEALRHQVFINIDAEHYHFRDIVFDIYKKILLNTEELKTYDQTGIVVQAYLRDGIAHLNEVIQLAEMRKLKMPVRLVKGAYWDAETIEADAHNFIAPQFLNKEETDIHFRQLIYRGLQAGEHLILSVASHNIHDHCFAESLREKMFSTAPIIEHQCLHMTYEALSIGLSMLNWPTRNYIPVGDLLVGMAYLVRRIMENSSQVGVLTIMRSHKKGLAFKTPTEVLKQRKSNNQYVNDHSLNFLTKEFKNVFPVRSYLTQHFAPIKDQLTLDLDKAKRGELYFDDGNFEVYASSHPEMLIGKVALDTPQSVALDIEELYQGFQSEKWAIDSCLRFTTLHKLADLILFERNHFASLIMLEAGKTIDEATADVDEAIDFIQFYIREQMAIEAESDIKPRGVVGVIAPWNFPLAIPCGMAVAALVAGNTVILKPAEQTMLVAKKWLELAKRAGIPNNVLKLVLGDADVGTAVVEHELTTGIVFTGSKAVGEQIYRNISCQKVSARYGHGEINKFAITEMGGKNAIIVTNNCELDETVSGIVYAAFAHAGQKCSAASRIIIDNEIKAAFLARFIKAIHDLPVGASTNFSTMINPLISAEDKLRVQQMAAKAAQECQQLNGVVHVDRSQEIFDNFCVGPSLFELPLAAVLNDETVASQEVFGPLLHLVGFDHLDEAIELFNATKYALTGGIYCQSQDDIEYLIPKLECGNIYINRPNTGARVAIEPFGGFKMSGTGPKAGGADYLHQFSFVNTEVSLKALVFDKGINSSFERVAQVSKTSPENRLKRTRELILSLEHQFEVYFEKIGEQEKEKLSQLRQCIENGVFNLHSREYPNRYIPGQMSFNRRDMLLGSGLIVDDSPKLNTQSVLNVLINLIIGNGISIVATTKETAEKWQRFVELCYLKGFSQYNLNLSLVERAQLEQILASEKYHFVIEASNELDVDLKRIIFSNISADCLIKVFKTSDWHSWEQGLSSFTHTRSFAINTMRHGAPLELSL